MMKKVELKKGLFGYTPGSVREYIEALNGELSSRTYKLGLENDELKEKCERYEKQIETADKQQDELLAKISSLSNEKRALVSEKTELNEQIHELQLRLKELQILLKEGAAEKANYEQGQNELADVMIEVKRFAKDLKRKTEIEYEQKRAANNELIDQEKQRIKKYISNIQALESELQKVCSDFGKELNISKEELNAVFNELSA